MPPVGSLAEFRNKSKKVCDMTYAGATQYRNSINATLYVLNGNNAQTDAQLPYYCFLSAYSLVLLEGNEIKWNIKGGDIIQPWFNSLFSFFFVYVAVGYGFPDDTVLQVTDTLNGHKVKFW